MGLEIVKWRLSSYVEKVRRRLSARQIRHEHYTEQLAAATASKDARVLFLIHELTGESM